MSSTSIGLLVFGCVFGGALLGMLLRAALPHHHLGTDTKDTVKLAMGLVATMAALVLGLLVASAKGSYDTQKGEVIQMAAKVSFLDRLLAMYGSETREVRELMRRSVAHAVDEVWVAHKSQQPQGLRRPSGGEIMYESIQKLSPQDEIQRSLKAQALTTAIELGQLRWLLFQQRVSSISTPMLVIVVFWLAIIFLSFGLFAPSNATVIVALMVAALSVSGAIFLILELDRPFTGLIQISSEPVLNALANMGQ